LRCPRLREAATTLGDILGRQHNTENNFRNFRKIHSKNAIFALSK